MLLFFGSNGKTVYLEVHSSTPHLEWCDFLSQNLTILIFKYVFQNVCDFNFIKFKEQTFLVHFKLQFSYWVFMKHIAQWKELIYCASS